MHVPELGGEVGGRRHEVRRVRTEARIPHPPTSHRDHGHAWCVFENSVRVSGGNGLGRFEIHVSNQPWSQGHPRPTYFWCWARTFSSGNATARPEKTPRPRLGALGMGGGEGRGESEPSSAGGAPSVVVPASDAAAPEAPPPPPPPPPPLEPAAAAAGASGAVAALAGAPPETSRVSRSAGSAKAALQKTRDEQDRAETRRDQCFQPFSVLTFVCFSICRCLQLPLAFQCTLHRLFHLTSGGEAEDAAGLVAGARHQAATIGRDDYLRPRRQQQRG